MTRPDGKPTDCMNNLPDETRQAVDDFLTMNSQRRTAADALSRKLLESIAIKNWLLAASGS